MGRGRPREGLVAVPCRSGRGQQVGRLGQGVVLGQERGDVLRPAAGFKSAQQAEDAVQRGR